MLGLSYWVEYGSKIVTGATGTAIGTGASNTEKIVTSMGGGTYAARICADLQLNGYDDWFLPSRDELYLMIRFNDINEDIKMEGNHYWSSSESDESEAWGIFSSFTPREYYKSNEYWIRPVRAF